MLRLNSPFSSVDYAVARYYTNSNNNNNGARIGITNFLLNANLYQCGILRTALYTTKTLSHTLKWKSELRSHAARAQRAMTTNWGMAHAITYRIPYSKWLNERMHFQANMANNGPHAGTRRLLNSVSGRNNAVLCSRRSLPIRLAQHVTLANRWRMCEAHVPVPVCMHVLARCSRSIEQPKRNRLI